MVGDQIFLCLQTPADGSAVDADVVNTLGNSFADYGIVTTSSGHTFTYLGRYEQYSDINSSSFVDIGDGTATTSASDATTAAFAYVQFTDGTLKLEAQTTGISGNGITVTFELDNTSPFISGIDVAVAGTDVTITVPTNSDSPAGTVDLTIDQLAQAIRDSAEDSPLVNTLITAYTLSGGSTPADIENITDSPAVYTLGGSNNLDTYIKQKTGGLLYGFNLINGGNVYQPASSEFSGGDTTVTFQADVTVHGTDEFGFSRSLTLSNADYVIDIAGKKISEIRLTSTQLESSLSDLLAWKNCRVDISDIETLRGTSILAFADGAATYAEEALRHDAVVMPKIAPIAGFGASKYETLPAWYLGLFVDTGNATYIPSNTDYHQVSLIKNPQSTGGGNLSGPYFQPLQYFTFPGTQVIPEDTVGGTGDIGPGWQILQGGKKVGVVSHVQTVESGLPLSSYRYYYYNDHRYGYEPILVSSETSEATAITFSPPKDDTLGASTVTTTLIPDNNYEGSYEQGTGDVVFIDNRATITREEGQNEELKLIIQL